jgi:hypothetical protein
VKGRVAMMTRAVTGTVHGSEVVDLVTRSPPTKNAVKRTVNVVMSMMRRLVQRFGVYGCRASWWTTSPLRSAVAAG